MEKVFSLSVKHDYKAKGDYLVITFKGEKFGMLSIELLKTMQAEQMIPFFENLLNCAFNQSKEPKVSNHE